MISILPFFFHRIFMTIVSVSSDGAALSAHNQKDQFGDYMEHFVSDLIMNSSISTSICNQAMSLARCVLKYSIIVLGYSGMFDML